MTEINFVEIQGTFLIKVCDNAFNGEIGENVFEHINKFLEVVGPIKINEDETLAFKAKVEGSGGNATHSVIKFCTWLINSFGNFHELDYNVLVKLQECWWKINVDEVAPFTRSKSYGHVPYANIKNKWAHDPYLEVNNIFGRNYDISNTQDNQRDEERRDDPTLKPLVCKIRRFKMMKYSLNVDEEYIPIKESEYLNHSKDSLDAYQELLRIINDGWVVTTTDDDFGNFHELDYNVLVKLQECWWKINADEVAPFTRSKSYGHVPYANIKTKWAHDPYLEVNNIFGRNYDISNTQDNQRDEERRDDPTLKPLVCKIRIFEIMKYSLNVDEEYIPIKESKYLNHSKDILDAYQELLRIINDGWVVTTTDDE
nr:hypothetical protein [Tanacetum cinerariifolium]